MSIRPTHKGVLVSTEGSNPMGTLEEAFAQADEQLNSTGSESVEETEKEEVEETEADEVEEETTDESPKEDTPEDDDQESFTELNPEELPEELKAKYKSMQADYTRKTQELAKERKEINDRISKLEKQLSEPKSDEPPVEKSAQEQLREFVKSEIDAGKMEEFAQSAQEYYNSADPRLTLDADTYDRATDLYVGQEMDERLEKHVESGKPPGSFNYKAELKEVLNEWDNYLVGKQKKFLSEQQKKAKQDAKKVKKQNPKGEERRGRPKKLTLDEAISRSFEQS